MGRDRVLAQFCGVGWDVMAGRAWNVYRYGEKQDGTEVFASQQYFRTSSFSRVLSDLSGA